jgi:hypothetical protein
MDALMLDGMAVAGLLQQVPPRFHSVPQDRLLDRQRGDAIRVECLRHGVLQIRRPSYAAGVPAALSS